MNTANAEKLNLTAITESKHTKIINGCTKATRQLNGRQRRTLKWKMKAQKWRRRVPCRQKRRVYGNYASEMEWNKVKLHAKARTRNAKWEEIGKDIDIIVQAMKMEKREIEGNEIYKKLTWKYIQFCKKLKKKN